MESSYCTKIVHLSLYFLKGHGKYTTLAFFLSSISQSILLKLYIWNCNGYELVALLFYSLVPISYFCVIFSNFSILTISISVGYFIWLIARSTRQLRACSEICKIPDFLQINATHLFSISFTY